MSFTPAQPADAPSGGARAGSSSSPPEMTEHRDLIRRLAFALDAALPYFRRAAERERRLEAGKALRSVTKQQRAEMAETAVAEAFALLEIER